MITRCEDMTSYVPTSKGSSDVRSLWSLNEGAKSEYLPFERRVAGHIYEVADD